MFAPFPDKLSAITLGSRTPYGWPLAHVQHSELDGSSIRYQSHLTAKRVYLSDYLTFSDSAYSRIARHLCNLIHIHRHQTGLGAHVGRSASRFTTSMTTAYDDDIVI
jgi:hypothetical protein